MDIIAYGTPEFEEFVKNAPISLDEAWELQLTYMKTNIKNDFEFNFYKTNVLLFFIADENYVFTMKHINNKKEEGYYLSGVWVNAISGKVSEKDINEKIKSNHGWRQQN